MRHSAKAGISLVIIGMQILMGCPIPSNSLSLSLALAADDNQPKAVTEILMGASINTFEAKNNALIAEKNSPIVGAQVDETTIVETHWWRGPVPYKIKDPNETELVETHWWRGPVPYKIKDPNETDQSDLKVVPEQKVAEVSPKNRIYYVDEYGNIQERDEDAKPSVNPLLVLPEKVAAELPVERIYYFDPITGSTYERYGELADTTISYTETIDVPSVGPVTSIPGGYTSEEYYKLMTSLFKVSPVSVLPPTEVDGTPKDDNWILPADSESEAYYLSQSSGMSEEELERFQAFCGVAGGDGASVLFAGESEATGWNLTTFITGSGILTFGDYGDKFKRDGLNVMYRSSHLREGQPLRDIVYECFDLEKTFNAISQKSGVSGWYADIDKSNPEGLITIYLMTRDSKGVNRVNTRIVFTLKGMQEGYANVTDFDANHAVDRQDDETKTYQVRFNVPNLLERFSNTWFEYEKRGTTVNGASGRGSSSSSLGGSGTAGSSTAMLGAPSTDGSGSGNAGGSDPSDSEDSGPTPVGIEVPLTQPTIAAQETAQPAEIDRRVITDYSSVFEGMESGNNNQSNDITKKKTVKRRK